MPELPEVETIRSQLEEVVCGGVIEGIHVRDPLAVAGAGSKVSGTSVLRRISGTSTSEDRSSRYVSEDLFASGLCGRAVTAVERVGKVLVLRLGDSGAPLALAVHLRMSGKLLWSEPNGRSRVLVKFRDCNQVLNLVDNRRLGKVFVIEGREPVDFLRLGPDPMSADLVPESFYGMLRRRRTMIKPLLLNQKFLSGVGNIYAVEALFLAGIRPHRRASTIRRKGAFRLLASLREVLRMGLKTGGCSLRDYVDIYGRPGGMQRHLRVYGKKEGEPCPRCGRLLKFAVVGQRGTTYCPECQK